jgi:undecaprenyl-diphosphatase
MSIGSAILLGVVQGLTEFFPVSSSGHLSVLQNLFSASSLEGGHLFFDVLLHFGTLVAIFIMYWADIRGMLSGLSSAIGIGAAARLVPVSEARRRQNFIYLRLFIMVIFATLPIVLILPFKDSIESLFYNTTFIGVMFLLTSALLFVGDKLQEKNKNEKSITILDAVIIGICQCVATIPGLSRSGTTIVAGLSCGLERSFAIKFAFLMSIPAVLGANLLSIIDAAKAGIDWALVPVYLAGMITATLSGILAIGLMKLFAKKAGFKFFYFYCLAAGIITIVLSLVF